MGAAGRLTVAFNAGALNPLNCKVNFIEDVWASPARQALWYARIDAIWKRRFEEGKDSNPYKHHPLEERALFLASTRGGPRG